VIQYRVVEYLKRETNKLMDKLGNDKNYN